MKYYLQLLLLILITFGCNNDPKQPETVAVDTTVMFQQIEQGETKRTSPPLGMGVEKKSEGIVMGRALAAEDATGETRYVLENKDTMVTSTSVKTITYPETSVIVKKYVPPTEPPVNKAPTANAGIDKSITLPVSTVQLIGSGTDSDGSISSYTWIKLSGGVATISQPTSATTNVTGLIQGVHVFRLTVKDNGGLTASDEVNVTVNAALPPTGQIKYLQLPETAKMDLSGKSNLVIEGKQFKNVFGHALKINNASNITIKNCLFNGATDELNGELISIENSSNITIENCVFARGTNGVYAQSSTGIKINNNQFVNFRMRPSGHRGNFIQFNGVYGAGNQIMNNKGENFPGESNPEDMISLYGGSSGTASSPIIISGNWGRGGCPSTSGGGILAGDFNGAYVIMENNSLMNPGQYGMAIAGGNNIKILNNKIYSDRTSCSNNPLYVWAQQGAPCSNNLVQGNFVNWIDKDGNRNNGWNSGNCSNTIYNPSENKTITKAQMNFPDHLIDKLTPAELLTIRK